MAVSLFGCSDASKWMQYLKAYDDALASVAKAKKKADLVSLDRWCRCEWPNESRTTKGLTHDALVQVASWKLQRGHFRPLLPRIKANSAAAVKAAWGRCLNERKNGSSAASVVAALAEGLDCVGPATASAILAPCFEDIPFMSDEAVLATGCPLKYDLKTYAALAEKLGAKAQSLGKAWTAERVGRALWVCSVLDKAKTSARDVAPASGVASAEKMKKRPASDQHHQERKRAASTNREGIKRNVH